MPELRSDNNGGNNPGNNPGSNPGSKSGSNPGSKSGNKSGNNRGKKFSGKGKGSQKKVSAAQESEEELLYIPPRTEERILIEHTASLDVQSILCLSTGRAQHAGFLADQNPQAKVVCHYLDTKHARLAREYWCDADYPPEIICSPDLPEQTFEVVCLPILQQGNAELNREFLQQAHLRLKLGGTLHAAINNPTAKWLHEQLSKIFPKVSRVAKKTGTYYSARKTTALKRERKYRAEFSIRMFDQDMTFQTRPGIFSHRSIDNGTWALMKSMEIRAGMNVLDFGCGSGAVSVAALLAGKKVTVTAIDSNSRAIECTRINAQKNLPENVFARLNLLLDHSGDTKTPGAYDLVVVNPPFFSKRKNAHTFMTDARRALRQNGKILIVTQMPHWYEEHLPHFFRKIKMTQVGDYSIIQGHR